jgi:hypothetical protein
MQTDSNEGEQVSKKPKRTNNPKKTSEASKTQTDSNEGEQVSKKPKRTNNPKKTSEASKTQTESGAGMSSTVANLLERSEVANLLKRTFEDINSADQDTDNIDFESKKAKLKRLQQEKKNKIVPQRVPQTMAILAKTRTMAI